MLTPLSPRAWTRDKAAHLLQRAGFGGPPAAIDALHALGLDAAVRQLVEGPARPLAVKQPPALRPRDLTSVREMVQDLAGMTEGDAQFRQQVLQGFRRIERRNQVGLLRDLLAWWLDLMRTTDDPLREKLTLFWHGHFATSAIKVQDAFWMSLQNDTLRRNARGNFGALAKAISRDPAMIIWLDLRDSRAAHPNENFSRELMELFTLGEGHYTEQDVTETARAFTGYRLDPRNQSYRFSASEADRGEKTIFGERGPWGGDAVLDLILRRRECARFVARKAWEFFAFEQPDDALADALGEGFHAAGYEVRPLLRRIFLAEEFYAPRAMNAQVKSPVQWLIQTARTLELAELPPVPLLFVGLRQMGQVPFLPPSVKGWDGGRAWISTGTLLHRYNLAGLLLEGVPPALLERLGKSFPDLGLEPNARPPGRKLPGGGPPDYARLAPPEVRATPAALADALGFRLFAGPAPERVRAACLEFLSNRPLPFDDATVRRAMHLMMSTPAFQLC